MMESYKKKDGVPEVTMTAASVMKNRYHFAGDGQYKPISVEASTIEEATEIWKATRVPLESSTPENVGAPAEQESLNDNA